MARFRYSALRHIKFMYLIISAELYYVDNSTRTRRYADRIVGTGVWSTAACSAASLWNGRVHDD